MHDLLIYPPETRLSDEILGSEAKTDTQMTHRKIAAGLLTPALCHMKWGRQTFHEAKSANCSRIRGINGLVFRKPRGGLGKGKVCLGSDQPSILKTGSQPQVYIGVLLVERWGRLT